MKIRKVAIGKHGVVEVCYDQGDSEAHGVKSGHIPRKEFADAMRALMGPVAAVSGLTLVQGVSDQWPERLSLKSMVIKEVEDRHGNKNEHVSIKVTVGGFATTDDNGTLALPKLYRDEDRHHAAMPAELDEAIDNVVSEAVEYVKSVPPVIMVQAEVRQG